MHVVQRRKERIKVVKSQGDLHWVGSIKVKSCEGERGLLDVAGKIMPRQRCGIALHGAHLLQHFVRHAPLRGPTPHLTHIVQNGREARNLKSMFDPPQSVR